MCEHVNALLKYMKDNWLEIFHGEEYTENGSKLTVYCEKCNDVTNIQDGEVNEWWRIRILQKFIQR